MFVLWFGEQLAILSLGIVNTLTKNLNQYRLELIYQSQAIAFEKYETGLILDMNILYVFLIPEFKIY